MYYYCFQTYRAAWKLVESIMLFNKWLSFKQWITILFIICCIDKEKYKEYDEYLYKTFWFVMSFKLIPIIWDIVFYSIGYIDFFWNLSLLDRSDVNTWDYNSRIWNPIWHSNLKRWDYFTLEIGERLNILPLYSYKHLYYPNPKSFLILDVCIDAYREILNNGATFTYHLTPWKSQVLGIDTIGPDPSLDGLILMNTGNLFYLGNYQYWEHHYNYFNNLIFDYNLYPCDFLDWNNSYAKMIEMMRHLAWIKGRFDTLNDNIYESEKMEKWIELTWLLIIREFIKHFYDEQQYYLIRSHITPKVPNSHGFLTYVEMTLDDFKNNNPNDILRKHLEKYQTQQDALEQARQAALVDDEGNDDQTDASSLIGHLNAIDDTY